jgi:hypothetical protein
MATVIDGSAGITTNAGGSVNPSTTIDGINYSCRAWVNFDATKDTTGATSTANTNRLIRGSGNVASVLRNGTGDYTVTFTTAMTDANYAVNLTSRITATGIAPVVVNLLTTTTPTASLFRICTDRNGVGPVDTEYIFVSVFR